MDNGQKGTRVEGEGVVALLLRKIEESGVERKIDDALLRLYLIELGIVEPCNVCGKLMLEGDRTALVMEGWREYLCRGCGEWATSEMKEIWRLNELKRQWERRYSHPVEGLELLVPLSDELKGEV